MISRQYLALGIALVVIVAGLVGLASRGDEEQAGTVVLQTPGATSAAPTPSPPPPGTEAPPPRRTATAPPPAPPAATEAPPAATEAPAAPETSGETTQPRPGAYTYRETSDGETSESTLQIADLGGGRQTETFEEDDISSEVTWRSDGKYIESTDFGQGFECDWVPPIRELALPLAEGSSWELTGSCEITTGVTASFDGTSRVTGSEVIAVGAQDVATWVLATQVTLTFTTPQDSFEQEITSDDRFAPRYGLYVRSVETAEGDDPQTGGTTSETTTRELVSVEPS